MRLWSVPEALADELRSRMMCRHCNFQFCWLCMKDWDVHGYNDKVRQHRYLPGCLAH
jgi:hypothetical protein